MSTRMAPDLLTQITRGLGGETLNQLAGAIGETPAKTETALGSLVPAVLGGLATKATTTEGANDVVDVIRKNNLTSLSLPDLTNPELVSNTTNTGRSMSNALFGDRLGSITDWVGSNAGMKQSSVTTLASLGLPLILGLIGRRLGSTGLNASSLTRLLGSPSSFMQYLPAGLASALGLGGAAATARRVFDDTDERVSAAPVYETAKPITPWKWLLPLLGIVLVGLLAYLLLRPQAPAVTSQQPAASRTEVAPAPVAPAPVAPAVPTSTNLGGFIDTKLPNGINLRIPSNGVENRLLAFIGDASKAVDNTTWFSFDRLEFETDSAKLKPSSREQLTNIASILNAYPQVNLKIGGYTDNTGNPAHNQKLSQDRADSTLNELVTLGVAKPRLAAEGYGEQFPVADNATPEGRQRNRRIDIRVTRK